MTDFRTAWDTAVTAGKAAADATTPVPMVVGDPSSGKTWNVPSGVCGYAWVLVRPGNSKFANWLKRNDLASKAYGGGVSHWVSDYGQSMEKKGAFAGAVAASLRDTLDMTYDEVSSRSRMD